jgi:hypothetical protein
MASYGDINDENATTVEDANTKITTTSDTIWRHLLRKDFIKAPREFHHGQNIDDYLKSVDVYCEAIGARKDDISYIMVNNLDDHAKYELFALPDYAANASNLDWIKKTLIQLHKSKTTEVTPLLQLMKMSQGEFQNIKEFASSLRVKAFQLMGHDDPLKREAFLIKAFLKGLRDRKLAAAIQMIEPNTLTEAIDIAKREKSDSTKCSAKNENGILVIANNDRGKEDRVAVLENEITLLREKIDYLISITTIDNRKSRESSNKRTGRQIWSGGARKSEIKCFNCNGVGHLAKDCRRPCKICKKTNHTSYNCLKRNPRKRDHVRVFQNLAEDNEDYENETNDSVTAEQDSEDQAQSEGVYFVGEHTQSHQQRQEATATQQEKDTTKEKKRSYKEVLLSKPTRGQNWPQDKRIENWVQFINGNGNKPKKHYSSRTVITTRRPELAANKPIVKARIESMPVKLFCDSGAECNTIDLDLFKKIQRSRPELTVYEDNSRIKCASGTLINCVGIANLKLSLGGQQSIHPFKIIPNMFPELIAGIKLMKTMNIRVNPAKDGVEVGQNYVPFLSKVRDENFCPQGNGRAPFYGAIRRC